MDVNKIRAICYRKCNMVTLCRDTDLIFYIINVSENISFLLCHSTLEQELIKIQICQFTHKSYTHWFYMHAKLTILYVSKFMSSLYIYFLRYMSSFVIFNACLSITSLSGVRSRMPSWVYKWYLSLITIWSHTECVLNRFLTISSCSEVKITIIWMKYRYDDNFVYLAQPSFKFIGI